MPFNQLQRRDSWPPTIVRLTEEDHNDAENIDENPISFFLTSPEDIDDFLDDDEDLSAGIETPDSERSPVRAVSPSNLEGERQRPLLDDDEDEDDYDFGLAVPMTLKEFTLRHTSGRKSRSSERPEEKLKGLGIAIPEYSNSRGRAQIRMVPAKSTRGRGQTRSLSARRPQSWREPSPEIFPIPEERESDEERFESKTAEAETLMSSSAPTSTRFGMGGLKIDSPKPKPKKRVHWAL